MTFWRGHVGKYWDKDFMVMIKKNIVTKMFADVVFCARPLLNKHDIVTQFRDLLRVFDLSSDNLLSQNLSVSCVVWTVPDDSTFFSWEQ